MTCDEPPTRAKVKTRQTPSAARFLDVLHQSPPCKIGRLSDHHRYAGPSTAIAGHSKVLNPPTHLVLRIAVGDQQAHRKQLADRILLLVAVEDAGVRDASFVPGLSFFYGAD
jgi:hypothetical protein